MCQFKTHNYYLHNFKKQVINKHLYFYKLIQFYTKNAVLSKVLT